MTTDITRLQTAVRCLSILVAFELIMDFVSPALWVLAESGSVLGTVARLSSSPTALAVCWLLAAALVLPFTVMQIGWPDFIYRRVVIKTATHGLILGAVVWVFMAFLSRNLDYKFAIGNFLINGLASLALAALMAYGLNNDQKETARKKRKGGV